MNIISNTLVKNGRPFLIPVLEAAYPFVYKMIITVSLKSNDGTAADLMEFVHAHPKAVLTTEDVINMGELTGVRQSQIKMSKEADWIWFLDDDDFWEEDQIKSCIQYLEENDVDAIGVNPYQILDKEHHDANWVNKKYFTKFFKNVDINYRHPWPRDLIYKGDVLLYHKTNPRVPRVPFKFWHLAAVKKYSFRKFDLISFNNLSGRAIKLTNPLPNKIFNIL